VAAAPGERLEGPEALEGLEGLEGLQHLAVVAPRPPEVVVVKRSDSLRQHPLPPHRCSPL